MNILGDILNVKLFHGGMAGIAAATTISCYVELLVLLLHYARKTSQLKPSPCLWLRMGWFKALSKGIPVMLHELTVFLAGIAINHIAFMFAGENLVSAVAAGNSIFALLLPGSIAVSGAVMTLGSVARGEADHKGGKICSTGAVPFAEGHWQLAAIEDSLIFERILNILKKKTEEGILVRIFYDDLGSVSFVDLNFAKKLQNAASESESSFCPIRYTQNGASFSRLFCFVCIY